MVGPDVIPLPHIYGARIKGVEVFCPLDPPPPYEAVVSQTDQQQVLSIEFLFGTLTASRKSSPTESGVGKGPCPVDLFKFTPVQMMAELNINRQRSFFLCCRDLHSKCQKDQELPPALWNRSACQWFKVINTLLLPKLMIQQAKNGKIIICTIFCWRSNILGANGSSYILFSGYKNIISS